MDMVTFDNALSNSVNNTLQLKIDTIKIDAPLMDIKYKLKYKVEYKKTYLDFKNDKNNYINNYLYIGLCSVLEKINIHCKDNVYGYNKEQLIDKIDDYKRFIINYLWIKNINDSNKINYDFYFYHEELKNIQAFIKACDIIYIPLETKEEEKLKKMIKKLAGAVGVSRCRDLFSYNDCEKYC